MATSVKMDEGTKSRLEELQALIKLQTGQKVTQQELLDRLVDRASDSREALVESFESSLDIVDTYRDRPLSFTDATTIALMDARGIDHLLSFDADFDGIVDRLDPGEVAAGPD